MQLRFIDANVFLRHLLADDPTKAPRARALLLRLEKGTEKATTSPLVLFEVIFTLHRSYGVAKHRVAGYVSEFLNLRGLQVPDKQLWRDALTTWVTYAIDFTDAYNVATMRSTGISEMYAWDRGYDTVLDIRRIEPPEPEEEKEAA